MAAGVQEDGSPEAEARPVFYRDERILRIVGQVVAVVAVLGVLGWLINNLFTNLDRRNIDTGFDVLGQPTNFNIPYDPGFDPRSSIWP